MSQSLPSPESVLEQLDSLFGTRTRRIIDESAELHIPMAAVAPSVPAQPPRTAVAQDGLRLGLGENGQHDYASPHGDTDMLDRTWQLAFTNDFRRNELIEHYRATTAIGGPAVLDPTGRRLRGTADRPGLESATRLSCSSSKAKRWCPL